MLQYNFVNREYNITKFIAIKIIFAQTLTPSKSKNEK